jgi:hypothetical protein
MKPLAPLARLTRASPPRRLSAAASLHAASGPAEFRFRKGRGSALGRGATKRAELTQFRRRRRALLPSGAPFAGKPTEDRPADHSGRPRRRSRYRRSWLPPRVPEGVRLVRAGTCSATPAATRSGDGRGHPIAAAATTNDGDPGRPCRRHRFDQAQADQSPVLIHSLDRVAVQLELANHRRWRVKPSRAQRGERHRLLTSPTQLLKRQTMLILNKRHQTELSTPDRAIQAPDALTASPTPAPARAIASVRRRYFAPATGNSADYGNLILI